MLPQQQGSFPFFRAFGVQVLVHWSWFILPVLVYQGGHHRQFSSPIWPFISLFTVFAIVLMHEFGHALACRSVGGKADKIVLWPLGGVAYVQPPARPGAVLWSIVAGPLVNLALVPITILAIYAVHDWIPGASPDVIRYVEWIYMLNLVLLIFNMLPVYPLDGGQTLQAILWYFIGRARSLQIVAFIGIVVAIGAGAWAAYVGDPWFVIMALFVGMQAYQGWRVAQIMVQVERQQREQQERWS
ncbi:MAG: M50 family metallopeptidase [Phycisphaeraceae bacterium]